MGLWGVGVGFPHRFKGFNLGSLFLVKININWSQWYCTNCDFLIYIFVKWIKPFNCLEFLVSIRLIDKL